MGASFKVMDSDTYAVDTNAATDTTLPQSNQEMATEHSGHHTPHIGSG